MALCKLAAMTVWPTALSRAAGQIDAGVSSTQPIRIGGGKRTSLGLQTRAQDGDAVATLEARTKSGRSASKKQRTLLVDLA